MEGKEQGGAEERWIPEEVLLQHGFYGLVGRLVIQMLCGVPVEDTRWSHPSNQLMSLVKNILKNHYQANLLWLNHTHALTYTH